MKESDNVTALAVVISLEIMTFQFHPPEVLNREPINFFDCELLVAHELASRICLRVQEYGLEYTTEELTIALRAVEHWLLEGE